MVIVTGPVEVRVYPRTGCDQHADPGDLPLNHGIGRQGGAQYEALDGFRGDTAGNLIDAVQDRLEKVSGVGCDLDGPNQSFISQKHHIRVGTADIQTDYHEAPQACVTGYPGPIHKRHLLVQSGVFALLNSSE